MVAARYLDCIDEVDDRATPSARDQRNVTPCRRNFSWHFMLFKINILHLRRIP